MLKYCIMNQMQHDGKRNVRLLRLQRLPYRVTARSYSRFRNSLPLTKSEIPHHFVVWNDRLGVSLQAVRSSLSFFSFFGVHANRNYEVAKPPGKGKTRRKI
jgi:hypothetical protein